ncbi:hypothetical protein PMI21_03192 [Pseudomonas sp. GM18]|uniref:hypothetical protein n=1 Tax=Pseudomonas sp. GM18 TaxID=1144324 RepID=UPI000272493F|nr:hypothetical protein [Pseudomonas sp. GM18]EJM15850.1 hypothetical protein PMI21_03192 [Pseudomonas sp. GM18]
MTIEEKIPAGARTANIGGGILSEPPVVKNLAVNGRIKKPDDDRGYVEVELDGLTNEAGGGSATLELVLPDGTTKPLDSKNLAGANVPLMFRVNKVDIPELTTPEAPTEYSVQFKVFDGDGNEDHSTAPTPLLARYRGPYATKTPSSRGVVPPVTYVNAPASGVLDGVWFNANPAGLRCKVAITYAFRHADDTHDFYLNSRALPSTSQTPIFTGKLDANGEFVVSVADLRALGNTTLYQVNRIVDVAGYMSVDSTPKKDLEVRQPPAVVFFPLTVPATGADGNTTLTLKHFNPVPTNVKIILQQPTNGAVGAMIEVKLENEVVGSKALLTSGGLEFELTYDAYAAAYGTTIGELAAKLTYTYKNGTAPIQDSNQITTVYMNAEYPPIGLLPPPDLKSENLPPVEVTGDTKTLNHLVPGDFGKPVTFTFKMWEMDVGDPLTRTATVGFYYNKEFMGDATIEPADTEVSISVDFAKVAAHGTGIKPAYCDIRYLDVDATVVQKIPTDVNFEANEVKLLEHVARTFNTDRVVSCPSFDLVTGERLWRVAVPQGQSSLPAGQSITIHADGYEDIAMTTPIGVPHAETKTVSATAQTIFDVNFTYIKTLQGPIVPPPGTPDYNYMKVWYETTIAGTVYKSPEVLHRVNVRNTSSLFCDGTA